jgi:hypothetical protein
MSRVTITGISEDFCKKYGLFRKYLKEPGDRSEKKAVF